MNKCKTCVYWVSEEDTYGIQKPIDPDTDEEMEGMHEVRRCMSPKLTLFEFPPDDDGAALVDGSNYRAKLYPAENYGCVNHEQ